MDRNHLLASLTLGRSYVVHIGWSYRLLRVAIMALEPSRDWRGLGGREGAFPGSS